MFDPKQHYENSSLREVIVEHRFIGEALRTLWQKGIVDVEILRSEFDGFGYDLVLSRGAIVRHIQLKSGLELKPVGISRLLAEKPSGCVLFIKVNDHLDMGPYFWFGGEAGSPLPEISTLKPKKKTMPDSTGKKQNRQKHSELTAKRFEKVDTLEQLMRMLLGGPLETAQ